MKVLCAVGLAVFISASMCFSEVIQNEIEIDNLQLIDLENVAIENDSSFSIPDCPFDTNLSGQKSNFDLAFYLIGVWDNLECGCGGFTLELFSRDTIWEFLAADNYDFTSELSLSDTSMFRVYHNTTSASPDCRVWGVGCPEFENPCPGCFEWVAPPVTWYLTKTQEKNYCLFRFLSSSTTYDQVQGWHYLTKIEYVLQNDGSLNFNEADITEARLNKISRAHTKNAASVSGIEKRIGHISELTSSAQAYDILGRKISRPNSLVQTDRRLMPAIYLMRKVAK